MGNVALSTSSHPDDRERDGREDGHHEVAHADIGRSVAVVGLAVAFEVVAGALHGVIARRFVHVATSQLDV